MQLYRQLQLRFDCFRTVIYTGKRESLPITLTHERNYLERYGKIYHS